MYASVHYTPWTRNNRTLSLPPFSTWTEAKKCSEPILLYLYINIYIYFLFVCFIGKQAEAQTHTHARHRTPSLPSLHNQLFECDTYLCRKWLFAFHSALCFLSISPLPAMCIIYNYNSHWFQPRRAKNSPTVLNKKAACKVQRGNMTGEAARQRGKRGKRGAEGESEPRL